MRGSAGLDQVCGCFPVGRHYPGIAERIARSALRVEGLWAEVDAAAPWAAQPFVVIDFETTGLNAEQDRILEVGVACFQNGQLSARKGWLVNPTIPVPEESRAVHKISDADLVGAPTFAEIVPELTSYLAGHLPVAYNAAFDQGFLRAELARLTALPELLPAAFQPEVVWIDPLVWARELFKEAKSKRLTDMCALLGIAIEQAHRAADDAEATGRVLLAIAEKMPQLYGELIRVQVQNAARQEVDMNMFRNRFAKP